MTLGAKVKEARQARHMTMAALAHDSGLTKGFISQLENGRSNPSIQSLRRIAASLNVSLQSLFDAENVTPMRQHTAEIPTRVFRTSDPATAGSYPKKLLEGNGTNFALVQIAPGQSLLHKGHHRPTFGLMVTLGGMARLNLGDERLDLMQGEVLVWDAAQPCEVGNIGVEPLRLLLSLEDRVTMPSLVESEPDYYDLIRQATNQTSSVEGPLRLVAMRQQIRMQEGR